MVFKPTLIYFVLFIFLCSCYKNSTNVGGTTVWFDSVINKSKDIYSTGDKLGALNNIRVARSLGRLSIIDELNYYEFCDFIIRQDLKDYAYCISVADSMLKICESNKGLKNIESKHVMAYNNKADALMSLGNYLSAYDFYFLAKKIASEFSDSCGLSKYSYSLSMILYKQQKYMESARYFTETYNEVMKCNNDFFTFYKKQELLDNLGLCYYNSKKYDTGIYYFYKALDFIEQNKKLYLAKEQKQIESAIAVVYGNLADIYRAYGKRDSAIVLLKKSIEVNLQQDNANEDAEIDQVKLARIYFEMSDIEDMKAVLMAVKAELDTIPNKTVELRWNKLMWELYAYENQPDKAYRYVLNYEKLNDSLINQNNLLMASDIEGRIKNSEKQYQLSLMHKDAVNEKIYLLITSLAAILAIVIIIIILYNSARTKRNLKILKRLNSKINEQKGKLEKALAELEHRDKDKTRILRSVAHDVMNPIAAIMALTDLLIDEPEHYTEDQKEMLGLIKKSCEKSIALSKDILEASLKLDEKDIKKEWINITEVLSGCVELLNFKAAEKGQKIVINTTVDSIMAFVNKYTIYRILSNLIGNAIKFSYENCEIVISMVKHQDTGSENLPNVNGVEKVLISVKDTGVGIPEKNKDLVFDMFTEAKNQGTAGEASHGLGLSISLQMAKSHGGNIWFESEEGKGTTFFFEFPVNDSNK